MDELKHLLKDLGLERYEPVLAQQDIDIEVLADITDQEWAALGLTVGHRRKLMNAAAKLRGRQDERAAPPSAVSPQANPVPHAERRQVTVLFSDLVGSTELSTKLDPEDLGRVLRQYRDACSRAIARHNGFLAKFLGDGVLAFFCYPQAHEDEAVLGVRAGLDIAREVAAIKRPDGAALQARVGLATGLVVVGELIGTGTAQEESIVGDTPNLAARLQALAAPGSVVISSGTKRLLGGQFDFTPLGRHPVKGFSDPITLWRVGEERVADSRFAAVHTALAPMVGRDAELSVLLSCWNQAVQGQGRAVLVSGEAGIGKSRLVQTVSERLRGEPHRRVLCQCSPFHATSALYPVVRTLETAAGIMALDGPEARLAKLESWLAEAQPLARRDVLLLAETMAIPTGERIAATEMTPAQHKTEALKLLANLLVALADERPVLLVVEDAHWMDPTTQGLVTRLLERVESARVLVVVTFRPEFTAPWVHMAPVTALTCARLGGSQCETIVRHMVARQGLASNLVREIVFRSDGVPLFVEELTKAVIESGTAQTVNVPATLQDSLMARLDRLGPVKEVAQTAAVLGRQFNLALLSAIFPQDPVELRKALEQLVWAELVFPHGEEGSYFFKHALIHQAAYESLLRSRRQALHEAAARALESRFAAIADSEPEVLAHHFAMAGLAEPAGRYWERAADRAIARSALAEASANLNTALESAALSEAGTEQDQRRLALLLKLAPVTAISKGMASPEMAAVSKEAHRLAAQSGSDRDLFRATWACWWPSVVGGKIQIAREHLKDLIVVSKRVNDDALLLESHHCGWNTNWVAGAVNEMKHHCTESLALYRMDRHHAHSVKLTGHDVGVCGHVILGNCHALAGRPERAAESLAAGLSLGESLGHPGSLGIGLGIAGIAFVFSGDRPSVRRTGKHLDEVARKFELLPLQPVAAFMLAWSEETDTGQAEVLPLLESEYGKTLRFWPMFACLFSAVLAEAKARCGQIEGATTLVDRMLAEQGTQEIGLCRSELWRVKGELQLALDATNAQEAERCLRTAIGMAKDQGALLLELRAANSLARLLGESGRRDEARGLLAPVLGQFTEGLDRPDPAAASQLLKEL